MESGLRDRNNGYSSRRQWVVELSQWSPVLETGTIRFFEISV